MGNGRSRDDSFGRARADGLWAGARKRRGRSGGRECEGALGMSSNGRVGGHEGLTTIAAIASLVTVMLVASRASAEPDYQDQLERAKTVAEVDLIAAQAKAANKPVSEDDVLVNVLRAGTFEVCDADRDVVHATDKAAIDVLLAKGIEAEKRAMNAFGPWSRSATRGNTHVFARLTDSKALLDYVTGVVRPYYEAGGGDGSMPANGPWNKFASLYATGTALNQGKVSDETFRQLPRSKYFDELSLSQRGYAAAELHYALTQSCASFLRGDAKRRKAQADNLCGGFNDEGTVRRACFAYGVETAAISQVYLARVDGTRWASLVSVAVPFAGVRVPIDRVPYLSVDIMAYSAFLSFSNANADDAKAAAVGRGCSRSDSEFEKLLPCNSNPSVRPYFGLQVGATLGRSNVGYLNLSAVSGMTSIANLPGLYPYFGFSLSFPSLTGVL